VAVQVVQVVGIIGALVVLADLQVELLHQLLKLTK
jgi:hypothetical protein